MFQSLNYLGFENNKYYYQLVDSNFTCEVSVLRSPAAASVILEYQKRNLSVPKNIALLYLFYKRLGHIMDGWFLIDKILLDKCHPELEYGKKYYNCVLNQYKRLLRASGIR